MISFRHMAVANSDLGFRLVVLCLFLLLIGCESSQRHFNKHVALFIFGDSLFDPGNNNYINIDPGFQANFWPYGESYFNPPSGRFSNGRLISDFIAEYAGLPLIPAYLDPHYNEFLYGANFASGGAGALVETNTKNFVLDLKTQLQYFSDLEKRYRKDLGDVKTEQLLSDAVYLFSCGCNDYLVLTSNNLSNLHYEEYVGTVIGNLTNVFKGIYEKGGRKIGIGTIPQLGCLPYVRAQQPGNTCNQELNTISSLHNRAFSKKLQELTQQFEGFMFANYDHSTALSERMKNPSKYGFKVGDSSCCGSGPLRGIYSCGGKRGLGEFELCDNPDGYVFFDAPHPSEAACRQFAELFWNGDSKVTSPYNLKSLFHGSESSQGHVNKHVALFIFGDSLFDPGNNNYINTTTDLQANFWPYGESYFNPPSGRFSDGRIIPDFIAEFAGLPLIPAYLDPHNNEFLYGANFASAGAGVLNETLPSSITLKTQLQYFTDLVKQYRKNLGDVKAEQLLSDAVYLFSCGSNDYQSNLYQEEYVGMVIGNLTQVFKAIHEKGGRKIGINMLTPLGCLLPIRATRPGNSCDEKLNIISSLHDNALSKKLQDLTQQWEGFMYSTFELQTEITNRMKNPSKYGLKVGNSACCGIGPFRAINSCGGKREPREFELCDNPYDYLLFDPFHPTEAANLQFAKLYWEGDSKVASPYNLKSLFQGMHNDIVQHTNLAARFMD
ncbi:unnamed protein product [Lactuca saligna]|uniref:GDSL esterase/lipase 1-like n=1 Tax=Lactuca saligna TaxID=75948 RepID=A0AA36EBP0_LACSI|nr:unnamed protein product [Lactuca saligna]